MCHPLTRMVLVAEVPCGPGLGLAVSVPLGVVVTSNLQACTLTVSRLPHQLSLSVTASPSATAARPAGTAAATITAGLTTFPVLKVLGGPGPGLLQFNFSQGGMGASGLMCFTTGCLPSFDTSDSDSGSDRPLLPLPSLLVAEAGNDRVQEVDVVRGCHMSFLDMPPLAGGGASGPRAVAASASHIAVSAWAAFGHGPHVVHLFHARTRVYLRTLGNACGCGPGQLLRPVGLRLTTPRLGVPAGPGASGCGGPRLPSLTSSCPSPTTSPPQVCSSSDSADVVVTVVDHGNMRLSQFQCESGCWLGHVAEGMDDPMDLEVWAPVPVPVRGAGGTAASTMEGWLVSHLRRVYPATVSFQPTSGTSKPCRLGVCGVPGASDGADSDGAVGDSDSAHSDEEDLDGVVGLNVPAALAMVPHLGLFVRQSGAGGMFKVSGVRSRAVFVVPVVVRLRVGRRVVGGSLGGGGPQLSFKASRTVKREVATLDGRMDGRSRRTAFVLVKPMTMGPLNGEYAQ
jgi:hypothetical protein